MILVVRESYILGGFHTSRCLDSPAEDRNVEHFLLPWHSLTGAFLRFQRKYLLWRDQLWHIISLIVEGDANHVGDDAENGILIKMESISFATRFDYGQQYFGLNVTDINDLRSFPLLS